MLCPFADIMLVTANVGGPMADIRGFAAHSQVGYGSLFTVFNNPARKASTHFWISQLGGLQQYVDTDRQAWAHGPGNPHFWSSEFEGMSTDAFTSAQIDKGGELIAWLHGLSSFTVAVNRDGLAGEGLTPHRDLMSTDCPGDLRLSQYPELILATLRHLEGSQPSPHHRRDTVLVRNKPGTTRVDTFAIDPHGAVRHSYGNTIAEAIVAPFKENLGGNAIRLSGDYVGEWFVLGAETPEGFLFYNVWNTKQWSGWGKHPNAVLLAG